MRQLLVAQLQEDVRNKFDKLCALHDQPALYVSDYFFELRSQIDYDTERTLAELHQTEDEDSNEMNVINLARKDFIGFLKQMEEKVMSGLAAKFGNKNSNEVYAALKQRLGEFMAAVPVDADLNGIEDAYVQLVSDLLDERWQLEKRVMRNQTFFYVPSERYLGILGHLQDAYLNKHEIECFRPNSHKTIKQLHQAIEKSINKENELCVKKPILVTRSLLLTNNIAKTISHGDLDGMIVRYALKTLDYKSKANHPFKSKTAVLDKQIDELDPSKVDFSGIEGFDETDVDLFKDFRCLGKRLKLTGTKMTKLGAQLTPLFKPLTDLEMYSSQNLVAMDQQVMESCKNMINLQFDLSRLDLGPQVSLSFLSSLGRLKDLTLYLPDGLVDFGVFKGLAQLESLNLTGLFSRRNPNKKRPVVTKQNFRQLSALKNLVDLDLSGFEMPVMDKDVFKGFNALSSFTMDDCALASIHRDTFTKCPCILAEIAFDDNQLTELHADMFTSHADDLYELRFSMNKIQRVDAFSFRGLETLIFLSLYQNQIETLPVGVFDSLFSLHDLELDHNCFRTVPAGLFDNLESLEHLSMGHNPIETVEEDAFVGLSFLKKLELNNCKLKAITNRMFDGLNSLETLDLADNQIESFELVIVDSCFRSLPKRRVISGIMSQSDDYQIVKDTMFSDLAELRKLSLARNKFEKLDLNFFCNLAELRSLDLSSNAINELNGQLFESATTLANLRQLNLENNRLERLHADFFKPFDQLTDLELSNNGSLSMTIGKNTFGAKTLVSIGLCNNPGVQIESDAFLGMNELRVIKAQMSKNSFSAPENPHQSQKNLGHEGDLASDDEGSLLDGSTDGSTDGSMDGSSIYDESIGSFAMAAPKAAAAEAKAYQVVLQASAQETLETFIKNPSSQAFFKQVATLSITDSALSSLQPFSLGSRFCSLTTLDLSKNQLKSIDASWLDSLPAQLKHLNFSGNLIETLNDPKLFRPFSALLSIDLSGNQLTSVHRRLLSGLADLRTLDMSNNAKLSGHIDTGMFRDLASLEAINLSGMNLTYLDLGRLFKSCRELKDLNLANNQLDNRSINEHVLPAKAEFTKLMLGNNKLDNLNFLRNVAEAVTLDVSNNMIKSVEKDDDVGVNLFEHLYVTHLDLSGNQLTRIDLGFLANVGPGFKYLDASKNPFETPVKPESFEKLECAKSAKLIF